MERYWNKEIETMDREQLQALQLERLRSTVEKVYENVPYPYIGCAFRRLPSLSAHLRINHLTNSICVMYNI